MASTATPQATLPADLLRAKEFAVMQYLVGPNIRPRPARPHSGLFSFAFSTRPQDNVVGIGVGSKLSGGRPSREPAVRFYVERKVPVEAIPPRCRLPEAIDDIPTDVIETGRFNLQPARAPITRRRRRPAQPGGSVGFRFAGADSDLIMAGTFGAIVEADDLQYILSNNHILANLNELAPGTPIFQPGLLDSGNPETDQIAELGRFIELDFSGPNRVDCAIAKILNTNAVDPTFLPKVGALKSRTPVKAYEGMQVHKIARTTGYTTGGVVDPSAAVKFDVGTRYLTMEDQVLIDGGRRLFSERGDSGAVVVDRDTGRAMALLVGGVDAVPGKRPLTVASPLAEVLTRLGVRLVI